MLDSLFVEARRDTIFILVDQPQNQKNSAALNILFPRDKWSRLGVRKRFFTKMLVGTGSPGQWSWPWACPSSTSVSATLSDIGSDFWVVLCGFDDPCESLPFCDILCFYVISTNPLLSYNQVSTVCAMVKLTCNHEVPEDHVHCIRNCCR